MSYKQAQTILIRAAVRRQFNELPDELWRKISIGFYKDSADAVFKALFDKKPVTDFQSLFSGYDSTEFESSLRSTLPLLSLSRDGRAALQKILTACNFPSKPDLQCEFTVDSPKGVGLPFHTDLMARSGNSQRAVEAKHTAHCTFDMRGQRSPHRHRYAGRGSVDIMELTSVSLLNTVQHAERDNSCALSERNP